MRRIFREVAFVILASLAVGVFSSIALMLAGLVMWFAYGTTLGFD